MFKKYKKNMSEKMVRYNMIFSIILNIYPGHGMAISYRKK